ncbi:hypothetical protein ACRCPS_17920 [Pseudomonas aeruginosa]
MEVTFMSRLDLEDFTPPPGAMLIVLSDDLGDKPRIDPTQWAMITQHAFVDGGYDEETIAQFGSDYDRVYADYITPEKAEELRRVIMAMANARPPLIVASCQAGRSRSAAVAQYIKDHYGAALEKETPEANQTVLRLLRVDFALNNAIAEARSGSADATQTQEQEPQRGFLSKLLEFFGVQQTPN